MPALLDTFPYPWHLSDAQELHIALCEIYPTAKGAMFVAQTAGLNPAMLNSDQPAYLLWKDVLEACATGARTRVLVTQVRDKNPTNPRRAFFEALLNAQPAPADKQPRGADGAPVFLKATDEVSEPEALLFYDDLTLAIGRVPWLIETLQRLQALAPAVCRMKVSFPTEGQMGTGFRIADDLLLTNWHVFNFNGAKATQVTAEFGYDDDGKDGGLPSTAVACDVASVKGEDADDWAVIRVRQPLAATIPVIKLSNAVDPAPQMPAFIIQHPAGERKRVAYVRNQITEFDDRVVQYLSDTQSGSSGSPVFDDRGRLVALHHAGGRPQEVAGRQPIKKNEGIRIPRIVSGLQTLGITVP